MGGIEFPDQRPIIALLLDSITLPLGGPLVRARFVDRPNRFLLRVVLAGSDPDEVVEAHLPDPGRLRELLLPGAEVWLREADGSARRTRWTAVLVRAPDGSELISLDTTLPNRLLGPALASGSLEEFEGWALEEREWSHGRSRFDFLLQRGSGERLVLEVKSVTLVEDRTALFPDAVTSRGARHVRELAGFARREGWKAAVLFVVQRADADRILPAREIDPVFADALLEAHASGVRIFGRRSRVDRDGVTLGEPVEVVLPDPGESDR